MKNIVFDGRAFARLREKSLASTIRSHGFHPRMASIVFKEDSGSMLYTRLKKHAAVRVGIEFNVRELSITESVDAIREHIRIYCERSDIHGVLVQKPMRATWSHYHSEAKGTFGDWWHTIVNSIEPDQDVDCISLANLEKVHARNWNIVPATVKAVISILHDGYKNSRLFEHSANFDLHKTKISVIGRSEIVGTPLAEVLRQYNAEVHLFGHDLDRDVLRDSDVIVSATGKPDLVTGEMVKSGVVVIDVGAPRGDVHFESVKPLSSFITPVPGGVGPVTVVSLLENLVDLMIAS